MTIWWFAPTSNAERHVMAKFDKDSFGGTMGIVLAISLVCSVVVAGAAVGLKPTQNEKKLLDKQKTFYRQQVCFQAA